jgi:phage portal protein BeeE
MIDRLYGRRQSERMSLEEYAAQLGSFQFGGIGYGFGYGLTYGGLTPGIQQTLGGGSATELAPNNFVGLATQAYATNGVVFACMYVRQLVMSTIRFNWQRVRNGKPSETFGNQDLAILERPWINGTTQDLLSRMIQDADLAGNSYWVKNTSLARLGTNSPNSELVRLRPDWVDIVVEERQLSDGRGQLGWRKVGYLYHERGLHTGVEAVGLLADEVAHFCPIPDPLADYRGMSWITPVLREIQADHAMTKHQSMFFSNGATVNMIIKHNPLADPDAIRKWSDEMQSKHGGASNAWKNLNLYPGADATPVGSNLKDIDFSGVREGGEVRIAAAAGVPPVIVGLSKGLDSATYANYGQARRRFADGTAHPLWQNIAGTLQQIMPSPGPGVRLWYDACDVPFLREDEADAANIAAVKAATINTYITAGYTPESVVSAVESDDLGLLVHSGLMSVQLQPPGVTPALNADTDKPLKPVNPNRSDVELEIDRLLNGGINGAIK